MEAAPQRSTQPESGLHMVPDFGASGSAQASSARHLSPSRSRVRHARSRASLPRVESPRRSALPIQKGMKILIAATIAYYALLTVGTQLVLHAR